LGVQVPERSTGLAQRAQQRPEQPPGVGGLAAGDHKVRLINPDLQKDIVRTVHITASEKEVLKEILDE